MEHRWNERKDTDFQVLLYRQGHAAITGRLRNLGLEGMYIETGPRDLAEGMVLHVAFSLEGQTGKQHLRLPALVVHHSEQGVGMMLFRPMTTQLLERILRRISRRAGIAA